MSKRWIFPLAGVLIAANSTFAQSNGVSVWKPLPARAAAAFLFCIRPPPKQRSLSL